MSQFAPSGGGGAPQPIFLTGVNTPAIANVAIPLANTEVSYTLPADTKWFEIKLRNSAPLKLSYTVGQSGTIYVSLPAQGIHTKDGITAASITLYFQSTAAGSTAEIESWS